MKTRPFISAIAISLAVAVPLGPLWGHLPLPGATRTRIDAIEAQTPASHWVYAPLVNRGVTTAVVGPPEFEIVSPVNGADFGGMQYFEIQPVDPVTVRNVEFRANDRPIGIDTNGIDGWMAFIKAADYPAGNLKLTATAAGPGGNPIAKSITVTVDLAPPSNITIQPPNGGSGQSSVVTLGTESGGTIVVPSDAAVSGTTIAVRDKSKEEIKAQTGIDYDALGITFLGGIDIQTSAPITKPIGVNTLGFGNRVKPGEAVLTFQLLPDGDGDGVGELVMANGATVGPDNSTVLSDPEPNVSIKGGRISSLGGTSAIRSLDDGLRGPPGTILTLEGSGFNLGSPLATVAVFQSAIDGREYVVPGAFAGTGFAAQGSPAAQATGTVQLNLTLRTVVRLSFALPPLPPGAATVTVRNDQTGSVSAPIPITVEPAAPLTRLAPEIIDEFLDRAITLNNGLDTKGKPETTAYQARLSAQLAKLRQTFADLKARPEPEVQQILTQTAQMIVGSGILSLPLTDPAGLQAQDLTHRQNEFYIHMSTLFGATGSLMLGVSTLATIAGTVLAPLLIGAGIFLVVAAILIYFLVMYEKFANPCRTTTPSPIGFLMGAGSAPLPGGVGCGYLAADRAAGNSGLSARTLPGLPDQSRRFVVKIFSEASGARATPFTGVSDKNGYFFLPLIPAGEAFTAIALDTATGQTRSQRGMGPAVGNAVQLLFDFTADQSTTTPIAPGQVISTTVRDGDDPRSYSFPGSAGTVIGGSYGWTSSATAYPALSFSVLDPTGAIIGSFDAASEAPTGTRETPEIQLAATGQQSVLVSEGITGTGSYSFTFDVLTATVGAPDTVGTGAEFDVNWIGPRRTSDSIRLFRAGESDPNRYVDLAYVESTNSVKLRAPDLPTTSTVQTYEVRYLSGGSNFTLNTITETVSVTPPAGVSVGPPSAVASGAEFDVPFTGPKNYNDWVGLYATGERDNNRYATFAYVGSGSAVRLRAPDLPAGSGPVTYQVRYVSGLARLTWAEATITVTPVTASIDAPGSVAGGATFTVSWTGPNNYNDWVGIYQTSESDNNRSLALAYTTSGNPVTLKAPTTAGEYVVRYVSGQARLTWAKDPLTVK